MFFYATWCGPCKTLAPMVEELANQYSGQIKFVKINADSAQTLLEHFDIQGFPTLLLFKNGKAIEKILGLTTATDLQIRLQLLATTGRAAGS